MPKIISINSFRAGAGKTTIAANLAALLAVQGMHVCLVDANLHTPEVHNLFKLDERKLSMSLADYLLGKCAIEDTVYDLTPLLDGEVTGKVYLSSVFGKSNLHSRLHAEGYDLDSLKEGMEGLFARFGLDFILIDTYAGMDDKTLPLIAIADVLAVVMLLDKQDFQGTGVVIEIARKFEVPDIIILVNSVTIAFDAGKVKDEAEQAYRCPVMAVIPHDLDLLEPDFSRKVMVERLGNPIPAALGRVVASLIQSETEQE